MLVTANDPRQQSARRLPPLPRRTVKAAGCCLASAVLLAAAQDLPRCGWLIFVGLVPVCLVVDPSRFLRTWAAFVLVNAVYTALTIYWVSYAGDGYGWLLPVASVYNTVFMLIPAACCWAFRPGSAPASRLLILAAAWTLMEVLARHVLLGVSWALLGQPLADWPALAQGAALGGPESLSFLVVAVNVAIALAARDVSRTVKVLGIVQGPGLFLALLLWGTWRLDSPGATSASFRVAVIQPNTDQEQKWDPGKRQALLADLDRRIDRTLPEQPELIVLPETAVAGLVRFENDLTHWVRATVIRTRRPLLFGTLDLTDTPGQVCNVAILITPYNTVTTYGKTRLVPVAEYLPALGPLSGWLAGLRCGWVSYTPGAEPTTFALAQGVTFSTMICYEDIFPDLARDFAAAGAGMLITLGNTERFKHSCASHQQLRRARLTALAVGLPMVRCTNSGISCVIDCHGRVLDTLEGENGAAVMVEGSQVFAVPRQGVPTVYRRFGDALPLAASGVVIVAGIGGTRLRFRGRKRRRHGPLPLCFP
jgi:apolipoprotein N-acyltransferase